MADNASESPTLEDYTRVGIKALTEVFTEANGTGIDAVGRAGAVKLLNNIVDASVRTRIDTSAKLEALASIAARIVRLLLQTASFTATTSR